MPGTLVRIMPDGTTTEHRVVDNKKEFSIARELLGGYIERIRVKYKNKNRWAYVDEEGLLKGLSPNAYAMALSPDGHFLVGPLIIWIPGQQEEDDV
jgi:hypothetical protein